MLSHRDRQWHPATRPLTVLLCIDAFFCLVIWRPTNTSHEYIMKYFLDYFFRVRFSDLNFTRDSGSAKVTVRSYC